ncbi:MAG: AAA family ATPase [Bryobacteraceae bacterium]
MKLTGFRIQRYKSVLDSSWIDVSPLTVMVGKNESGKTSVLQALYKFNPFDPEPYSLDREWPRGHRRSRNEDQVVCTARFELTPEESRGLAGITEGAVAATQLEIARDYKGRLEVAFATGVFAGTLHPNSVDAACDSLPAIPNPAGDAFRSQARACLDETRRLVREGRFTKLLAAKEAHLDALRACLNPWNASPSPENEQEFLRLYTEAITAIVEKVASVDPALVAAHEFVVERIPTFIFMDEYHAFRGSAALDEVLQRKLSHTMTGEDRTLEMLLRLSGLTLESEVRRSKDADREQRQYDLDDAAGVLTKTIEGRWKQLKYEVKFAADGPQFFTFVRDEKDQGLIKLEERSRGFQWFFSFDLMLMYESQGMFKDCVILLDEPGLSLHPDAQRDLLQRLEEYANSNTLLYTTHLPFMIDLAQPQRIRVLNETKEGTIVTSDLTGCQPEARFTLEAALGIACNANLELAGRNLIIEGADDYWLISELSNLFHRSGLEGLPDDVLVMPASSASQAACMATVMVGRSLDVVVLLSSADGGNGLMKKWLSRYHSSVAAELLTLGAIAGSPNRAFGAEELFPEEFYTDIVKRIYKKELATAGLKKLDVNGNGSGRLSARIDHVLAGAGIKLNPRLVATALRSAVSRMKTADELPPETKARAEKVLKAINAGFQKEKHFWTAN